MTVHDAYLGPDYEGEPPSTKPVWDWLSYQYRALPEGVRIGVNTVVLTVAQSVIETGTLAAVTDWGLWGRSLAFAIALNLANLVWASVTPGKVISPT